MKRVEQNTGNNAEPCYTCHSLEGCTEKAYLTAHPQSVCFTPKCHDLISGEELLLMMSLAVREMFNTYELQKRPLPNIDYCYGAGLQ